MPAALSLLCLWSCPGPPVSATILGLGGSHTHGICGLCWASPAPGQPGPVLTVSPRRDREWTCAVPVEPRREPDARPFLCGGNQPTSGAERRCLFGGCRGAPRGAGRQGGGWGPLTCPGAGAWAGWEDRLACAWTARWAPEWRDTRLELQGQHGDGGEPPSDSFSGNVFGYLCKHVNN